jgi:hypothetical protein
MSTTDELVQWALNHAKVLEQDMTWNQEPHYEYWRSSPTDRPKIHARGIAALDFLERYAGHDSQWAIMGHKVLIR